jgi:filamentous hemagglutinin family protein
MRCVLMSTGLVAFTILASHPSEAQVTSDGTLNTSVNTVGAAATITNGTAAGSNLFHSFGQFSIPTSGSATFNLINTPNISTIFSRVTGAASNINGVIRTTNSSNPVSLFLLNPRGILFGPNARLNIGGSFVGTTANSIKFANGAEFVSTATPLPLLTMSVPIGLQMGPNPAAIVNQSIVNGNRGLEVAAGQNVLLVGGDIELRGGRIRASGGRVEVVSAAGEGTVQLNTAATAWQLSVPDNLPLGNFTASESGGIYVRGQGGGDIVLRAQNARFTGSGFLRAGMDPNASSVEVRSGDITITALGSVTIENDGVILNTVIPGAIGTSGDVTIKTGSLSLQSGGQISLGVAGTGMGGNVNIEANTISATGVSPTRPTFFSSISNRIFVEGEGQSGDINLKAKTINLSASGRIVALMEGEGQSGNITMKAETISLSASGRIVALMAGEGRSGHITITAPGSVTLENDALIVSTVVSEAMGTSGDVTIKTGSLSLQSGGQISLGVAGTGTGGNVNIEANTISATGVSPTRPTFASGIFSRIFTKGVGQSGDINLKAEALSLGAGSQIISVINGEGKGGDINLVTKRIEIDGADSYRSNGTAILNLLEAGAQGESGNINLSTDTLKLTNGGQAITNLRGQGSSGTIDIQAQDVVVEGGRTVALSATDKLIFSSGILSSVESNSLSSAGRNTNRAVGQAGKINLTTRTLTLSQGGTLITNSSADGNAGNVSLKADSIRIDGAFEGEQSGIYSTVQRNGVGNGGTIQIIAKDLTLTNQAIVTANTSGQGNAGAIQISTTTTTLQNSTISTESRSQGNAGTIQLTAQALSLDDRARLSSAAEAGGRAGNLSLQAQRTTLLNNSQITTRSTGSGEGGTVNLTGKTLILRNGASINAATASSDGGNLNLNLSGLLDLRDRSQLNAEAGGTGNGGNININAMFVVGWGNSDIIADAVRGNGGNVQIATQGIYGLKFRPQLTPKNDITASSQFGLNGTVAITDPAIDPTSGLVTLPDSLVDSSRQIATGCGSNQDNRFVATGRGGLLQNPTQAIRNPRPWNDLRDPSAYRSQPIPPVSTAQVSSAIVEASTLARINGQLELVAANSPAPLPQAATCARGSTLVDQSSSL